MKTKIGALVLLGCLSATASAQNPTVIQDIYSTTGVAKANSGETVIANAFSWNQGQTTADISVLPAILAVINSEDIPSIVESVSIDADGVTVGWNAADRQLVIYDSTGEHGSLEVRVFNLSGIQLAYEKLAQSTTTVSLSNFVPGYYVVAVTEDGKLIKTIKLQLK